MARNLFDNDASGSTAELDANFLQLWSLRDIVSTAAYASYSAYAPAGAYAFHIDASARTLFGTNASVSVGIEAMVQTHSTANTDASETHALWATGSSSGLRMLFGKCRSGTIGTHTSGALNSSDTIVSFDGYGSDGSAFQLSNRITFQTAAAASAGIVPGRIIFSTADSAGVLQEALRFTEAQGVLASSPAGGIGYRLGAGGTVTQATSKSTGVTLNAMCGSITMNGASLAASTTVGFTFTNSSVATADKVDIWIKSGGTNNSYLTQVSTVGSGSCRVEVRNTSGGSLSEALVLGFMVFKGTTS